MVIILYIVVAFADFLPIIKEKKKKEVLVYSVILLLSFCTLMIATAGVTVPPPFKTVEDAITQIMKLK